MKVIIGCYSITCLGCSEQPTAKDLAKADRRIIPIGNIMDCHGDVLKDCFVTTLEPNAVYYVEEATKEEYGFYLNLGIQGVSFSNPVIKCLFERYEGQEVYIGTVVMEQDEDGEVFHDVYQYGLGYDERLFQKNDNGEMVLLEKKDILWNQIPELRRIELPSGRVLYQPTKSMLAYPDVFGFRMSADMYGTTIDYAFTSHTFAINKWIRMPRVVCAWHNYAKSVESLDDDSREFMQQFSKEVLEMFEKSYSTEGWLRNPFSKIVLGGTVCG